MNCWEPLVKKAWKMYAIFVNLITINPFRHSWKRRSFKATITLKNSDLGSISPTFYKQLLRAQISKAQKKTVKLSSFIALLGSASVKSAHRTLVKLTLADKYFEFGPIVNAFLYRDDRIVLLLGNLSFCSRIFFG